MYACETITYVHKGGAVHYSCVHMYVHTMYVRMYPNQ